MSFVGSLPYFDLVDVLDQRVNRVDYMVHNYCVPRLRFHCSFVLYQLVIQVSWFRDTINMLFYCVDLLFHCSPHCDSECGASVRRLPSFVPNLRNHGFDMFLTSVVRMESALSDSSTG